MGFFDGLKSFNEDVKETSGDVLDNDAFSVHDTVRGTIEAGTGWGEDGQDDFAQDSAQFFKDFNRDVIAAPGRMVGQATTGDSGRNALSGAVEGGEAVYETLWEDTGAIAYGTATGANVATNDPSHAASGYRPGALEVAEVGLTVGTSGVGGVLAKGATKGAKASVPLLDDAAGVIGKLVRKSDDAVTTGRKAGPDGAKATDDTVQTTITQGDEFANTPSKKPERLGLPDFQKLVSPSGAIDTVKNNKALASVAGVGALAGTMGLASPPPFPTGYTREHEYTTAPGGVRVKETDNAESVLGYWVVVESDGGNHTVLSNGGRTHFTVDFPTSRSAPFASPSQADDAYERYAKNWRDANQQGATTDDSSPNTPDNGPWGEASVERRLQHGWVLVKQESNVDDKTRYMVVAADSQGNPLFMQSSGVSDSSAHTFPNRSDAMSAYNAWLADREGTEPDPSQETPSMSDVVRLTKTVGTGVLGGLVPYVIAGGFAIALIFVLTRFVL